MDNMVITTVVDTVVDTAAAEAVAMEEDVVDETTSPQSMIITVSYHSSLL